MPTCKDCIAAGVATDRPAPFPGPRCATHNREVKRERSARAHESRVRDVYGLEAGDYERLLEVQGGECAFRCGANGRTRRLSVDHDHKTGHVRGLLCRPCNDALGHFRDSPERFAAAIEYLLNPPARQLGAPRIARKDLPSGKR